MNNPIVVKANKTQLNKIIKWSMLEFCYGTVTSPRAAEAKYFVAEI